MTDETNPLADLDFDETLVPYRHIIARCPVCQGRGFLVIPTETGARLDDCACTREAVLALRLDDAHVQARYRGFKLDDLQEAFRNENAKSIRIVERYCATLPARVKGGDGLYIQGSLGVAKSSLAAYIVEAACKLGIGCYVTRMSELVDRKLGAFRRDDDRDHVARLLSDDIQLVVLEDIDKVKVMMEAGSTAGSMRIDAVQDLLEALYDAQKVLLVTSNLPLKSVEIPDPENENKPIKVPGLDLTFPEHVIDRLGILVPVSFVGESFRARQRWVP